MPVLPGYPHYYVTRHLAQQTLRETLPPGEQETRDAELTTQAEDSAFRSGVILVLFMVGIPIIGIVIVALSHP